MTQPTPPPLWQNNSNTLTQFARKIFDDDDAKVVWSRNQRQWQLSLTNLPTMPIGLDRFQARAYLIGICDDTWLADNFISDDKEADFIDDFYMKNNITTNAELILKLVENESTSKP